MHKEEVITNFSWGGLSVSDTGQVIFTLGSTPIEVELPWSDRMLKAYTEAKDNWLHGGLPYASYLKGLQQELAAYLLATLLPSQLLYLLELAEKASYQKGQGDLRTKLRELLGIRTTS